MKTKIIISLLGLLFIACDFVETKNLPALPTGRQAVGRDDFDEVN